MSPRISGQFSVFGWKLSPKRSITSGVSTMSGWVSSRVSTRSAAAWEDWSSAKIRAMSRTGMKNCTV